MQPINDSISFDEVLATNNLVLAYFSGANCSVCHVLKPRIESILAKSYPEVTFVEIKTENAPELAAQFSVFSVPVILLFIEKKEYMRESRTIDLVLFEQKLAKIIGLYLL
jgi:thiol-disulfide isomerase/thioredoxin